MAATQPHTRQSSETANSAQVRKNLYSRCQNGLFFDSLDHNMQCGQLTGFASRSRVKSLTKCFANYLETSSGFFPVRSRHSSAYEWTVPNSILHSKHLHLVRSVLFSLLSCALLYRRHKHWIMGTKKHIHVDVIYYAPFVLAFVRTFFIASSSLLLSSSAVWRYTMFSFRRDNFDTMSIDTAMVWWERDKSQQVSFVTKFKSVLEPFAPEQRIRYILGAIRRHMTARPINNIAAKSK